MSSGEKTEREVQQGSRARASHRETAAPVQGTSRLSRLRLTYVAALTERKKESLFKNSPRLFRNLLDSSRRSSEEKQRGGSEELHHLVNNCEEFQSPPGGSAVTITHNSSYRIAVNNSEDIADSSEDNTEDNTSLEDKPKTVPGRKNTLSSGEVTVIVHHDENLDEHLDFYGIKRPNHKTVTNIFRFRWSMISTFYYQNYELIFSLEIYWSYFC